MGKMYKLYAHIIPVNGYTRSLFYDLHYEKYHFIPNKLTEFFNSSGLVKKSFNNKLNSSYFEFLLKKDFIHEIQAHEQKLFPKMEMDWFYPAFVTNIIIELKPTVSINLIKLFEFIEKLGTKHIQLISDDIIAIKKLDWILQQTKESRLQSIEIITKFCANQNYTSLLESHNRLKYIALHSSNENKIRQVSNGNDFGYYAESVTKIINLNKNKSNVYYDAFSVNTPLFTESQIHHTYFNRKLYIGQNGEIKNAPECEETFGNINDIKDAEELKKIIATPEFQKYWFVHKELCDICKDCEFRHMCVDNRLPYQRTDGSWYHKIECNYNPYICKWKDEEGYKTLEECGVRSNENDFSINHEKITAINKILWVD